MCSRERFLAPLVLHRGETISGEKDAAKLNKAAAYFREHGSFAAMEAVQLRLAELGAAGRPAPDWDAAAAAAAAAEVQQWQENCRKRGSAGEAAARAQEVAGLQAPVRGRGSAPKPAAAKGQAAAAGPRQSLDLLESPAERDQQLLDGQPLKIPSSGTALKPAPASGLAAAFLQRQLQGKQRAAAGAGRGGGAPRALVQEVALSGARRTQQLLEANSKLPEAERRALADAERHKGNEAYKQGAVAEAVEHYTVAVELCPRTIPAFTNRAACYLKLRRFQEAAFDCHAALLLLDAEPDDSLRAKALMRRAEAFMGLKQHASAAQDYQALLGLVPGEQRAQQGLQKALAALMQQQQANPGARRIAVQEASDDDDASGDEQQQQQQQQQQQAAAVAPPAAAAAAGDGGSAAAAAAGGRGSDDAIFSSPSPPSSSEEDASTCSDSDSGSDLEDVRMQQGIAMFKARHPPKPAQSFDSVTDKHRMAGNDAYNAGQLADAAECYSKALQHAPDACNVYHNRALVAMRQGRWQAAFADASTAVALEPAGPVAHKALATRSQARQKLGDFKGACSDLERSAALAPPGWAQKMRKDAQAVAAAGRAATAAATREAEAQQRASSVSYGGGSCVIEEVADDPAELAEARHRELQEEEASLQRRAAKLQQQGRCLRERWDMEQQAAAEHNKQVQEQIIDEIRQKVAAERAARRAAKAAARAAAKAAAKQRKTAAKAEQRAAETAAKAAAGEQTRAAEQAAGGGASSGASAAMSTPQRRPPHQVAAAAAAEPPTPPASPYDSTLLTRIQQSSAKQAAAAAGRCVVGSSDGSGAATPAAVQEALAAAAAVPAATPSAGGTPAATPAATPAVTPAHSFSAAPPLQQRPLPTPADVQDNITAQVVAHKERGNELLRAGDLAAAEEAYQAGLQLDPDNPALLLNLAQLFLQALDGPAALRCADEVLAQPGGGGESRHKATLRRGLALELMGRLDEALQCLMEVKEAEPGHPRLAKDLLRISDRLQRQQQQRQQQRLDNTAAASGGQAAAQRQAITGMRASIPIVVSDSEDGDDEGASSSNSAAADAVPQQQLRDDLQPRAAAPGAAAVLAAAAAAAAAAAGDSSGAASPADARRKVRIAVVSDSEDESSEPGNEPTGKQPGPAYAAASGASSSSGGSDADAARVGNSSVELQPGLVLLGAAPPADALATVPSSAAAAAGSKAADDQPTSLKRLLAAEAQRLGLHAGDDDDDELPTDEYYDNLQQLPRDLHSVPGWGDEDWHQGGGYGSYGGDADNVDSDLSDDDLDPTSADWPHPLASLSSKSLEEAKVPRTTAQAASSLARMSALRHNEPAGRPAPAPSTSGSRRQQQPLGPVPVPEAAVAQARQLHQVAFTELIGVKRKVVLRQQGDQRSGVKRAPGSSKPPAVDPVQRADEARQEGNRAAQAGQLQVALRHYGTAVTAWPIEPRTYASRAGVWLKLKRWQRAAEDCDLGLAVLAEGGESQRGAGQDAAPLAELLLRRAAAYKELGHVKEALADVNRVLADSSGDAAAAKLKDELREAYKQQLKQLLEQQQQQQQQQPGAEADANPAAVAEEPKPVAVPAAAAAAAAGGGRTGRPVQRHSIVIEEADSSDSDLELGDEPLLVAAPAAAPLDPAPVPAAVAAPAPAPAANGAAAVAVAAQLAARQVGSGLTPPKNSAEFCSRAKALHGLQPSGQQELGRYVALLAPAAYKSVFKKDLSAAVLGFMIAGLAAVAHEQPAFVEQALVALPGVERFSIVAQMAFAGRAGAALRAQLQEVLGQLQAAGCGVDGLKRLWGLP